MKKLLFTLMLLLMTMVAFAEKVEVNGLYYELINKTLTAEVVKSDGDSYSGNIVIPESIEYEGSAYTVTSIGSNSFGFCKNIISVEISNSVRSIKSKAFYGCVNLKTVSLSNNLEEIGSEAFFACEALSSINFPNSLKTIGSSAFFCCYSLTSLKIPDSVVSIGGSAFYMCTGLSTVSMGSGVETVKRDAFAGCEKLTSVNITDLSAWCKIDFSNTGFVEWLENAANPLRYAHHLYLNGEEIVNLVIPEDIDKLQGSFYGCTGIETVTFYKELKIYSNTFRDCSGLDKVSVPDIKIWFNSTFGSYYANPLKYAHHFYIGSEEIKELVIPEGIVNISNMFTGASCLVSVSLPNSISSVCQSAFYGCSSLKSIVLSGSTSEILSWAFSKCPEITDIYCYAEKVPKTASDCFEDSYVEYATLHVPANSISDYETKEPWKNFKSIVPLEDNDPKPTNVITISCDEPNKSRWYDLNGRKLDSEPSTKGIYINNGKKVAK